MKPLTEEERARVSDGKHNLQAASEALSTVDRSKIPNLDQIEECLEDADKNLREALQAHEHPPKRLSNN